METFHCRISIQQNVKKPPKGTRVFKSNVHFLYLTYYPRVLFSRDSVSAVAKWITKFSQDWFHKQTGKILRFTSQQLKQNLWKKALLVFSKIIFSVENIFTIEHPVCRLKKCNMQLRCFRSVVCYIPLNKILACTSDLWPTTGLLQSHSPIVMIGQGQGRLWPFLFIPDHFNFIHSDQIKQWYN